jgi:putative chitinase
MTNKKSFYDYVREGLFKNTLSTKQFEGIEAILIGCSKACVNDLRHIAYMLATVFHETAKTMQPIEEFGKGLKYDYGKKLKMSRKPYTTPNKIYYGRGLVQLTWYENYNGMSKILSLPLLTNPELLLTMEVSVKVMIEGMTKGKSKFGDFTGVSLENYFNSKKTDWVNARKIINGLDKSELIAGYAKEFYKGLILE